MGKAATSARWSDALVRRPAVSTALLFVAGIIAHPVLPACGLAHALAALVLALTASATFRRAMISITLLALSLIFAGVAAAQLESFYFPTDAISAYATDNPRLARVELAIDEPPRIIGASFQPPGSRPLPPKQVTTARVTRVLTKSGWTPAGGRILVQIDPPDDRLRIGQRIRALGMLQRPSPAMNPGQFDWAEYYREQRILTSIQLNHGGAIKIISSGSPPILARARQGVRAALARGFTEAQSLDHALLRALVLGDHDPELRDVQENFRRTGTSHHLAISGMHVAILGGLIYWLCHLLLLRPRWVAVTAMAAVLLYGLVALPSPPVSRSVILCLAVGFGLITRRAIDYVQLLALSVLALLVYHPLDLYNAGFQLSFGTVLALMVLTKRVLPLWQDLDADVALRTPGGKPPRRLIATSWIRRRCAPPVTAGMIAWVVSMPLIAYHFDQLNPWAVIASLALAFPVLCSLIAGFLKIILTLFLPFGAHWWASVAAIPVASMRHCVEGLATLPGSDVPLPAHSISFVIVYYALVLLPLLPIVRPKLKYSMRLGPALAVLLLAMVPLTGGAAAAPGRAQLTATALAVGAGQCCVIELPDGRCILLDAGSMSLADPVRKCIAPYLRSRGRSTIDEIWLSDCDYDHLGAAAELIRAFGVARIVISSQFEKDAQGKGADETLMETIAQRHVTLARLSRGDHVQLGKGASVDVLWPPAGTIGGATNNSDLVLKLNYARRTILLPADIQQPTQVSLLRKASELRCDAMFAPHHGSRETATAAFVAAADPLYIVSSNDRTLTAKQRQFERQIADRPLYRTNRCGATTIAIDRNGGLTVVPFMNVDRD